MDGLQALVRHVETLGRSYRGYRERCAYVRALRLYFNMSFRKHLGPVPLLYGYHDAVF